MKRVKKCYILLEKYGDYDYKIKNMDDNDRLIEGIDNIYKTIFHGVRGCL